MSPTADVRRMPRTEGLDMMPVFSAESPPHSRETARPARRARARRAARTLAYAQ